MQARVRDRRARLNSHTSHASLSGLPSLDLGSSMSTQVSYERIGRLQDARLDNNSRNGEDESIHCDVADTSKAQSAGHAHALAASIAQSVIHHVLFAKGQIPEPITVSRQRRQIAEQSLQSTRRRSTVSTKSRKEERILRKLDMICEHLRDALDDLQRSDVASTSQVKGRPVRLLLALGPSASMPREAFLIDLIDAVQSGEDLFPFPSSSCILPEATARQREKARAKTSGQWEKKLVRMMLSAEELESYFSSSLAPCKMHIFLSAHPDFRCPGWSARRYLDFDLSALQHGSRDLGDAIADVVVEDSCDIRYVSPRELDDVDSMSSHTSSWIDNSGSEGLPDTCNSSLSDTMPDTAMAECVAAKEVNMRDDTGTGIADDQPDSLDQINHQATNRSKRKSRSLDPNSLLSRNRLRPKTDKNSTSSRSFAKKALRCAGIRIDFGHYDSDVRMSPSTFSEDRCWFQCDSFLEGYR